MTYIYTGIPGMTIRLCEWCGNEIKGRFRSHCCSKGCTDKYWAHVKERRINSNCRPGMFWNEIKLAVFKRDNYTCQKCGTTERHRKNDFMMENMECHHIVAINHGGTNEISNLITLCHDCHSQSHGKFIRRKLKPGQKVLT